ncbi:MAG: arginine decarboxylase, pyruvoyl-dependent [Archaeoglobus sp.]|uniref:pyruvoyl-dependent arginine decarboxylase n=1 Tax=Archaeoglobus sp. TaxID=1872626 RepID=UPI001DAA9AEA|nr:arginine decarboxylase, pyruvoyl-dependent [Archaeoglobus sp.]MBO8180028.1 arginine decarboxylase, pyruvoyl-dependent [Archaeoglobus sp.]
MALIPKEVFFVSGIGRHEDALVSFELALRDAGIERFNLVPVSSIVPPNCRVVSKEEGLKKLSPGEIVFCVMARHTSNDEGAEIFASVGAAFPEDDNLNGYIAEHSGVWYEGAEKHAKKLAEEMLKTQGGKVARTFGITARGRVEKFTTAVAAAVFVI